VLALGQTFPARGPLCHHCWLRIPEFADLSTADRRRIRALIREHGRSAARPVAATGGGDRKGNPDARRIPIDRTARCYPRDDA